MGVLASFKPHEDIGLLVKLLLNASFRYKLSYEGFLLVLLCAYGYVCRGEVAGRYGDAVNYARSLIQAAKNVGYEGAGLDDMERFTRLMEERGYRVHLVDCLGLPEVYGVYALASRRCGEINVTVTPYINPEARTDRFKEAFKGESMAEVARGLSAPLFRSLDGIIHGELGEPVEVEKFVNLARTRLYPIAELIAGSAIQSRRAVVIADHGYDVYCSGGLCRASHTDPAPALSKIAPVIVIAC